VGHKQEVHVMVLFLMILSIFPPSQSPFYSSVTWHLNKDVLDGELQYRGQLYRKIHLIRAE
jgi:hypothetical protein